MASCTVRGVGDHPVLPKTELNKLKTFFTKFNCATICVFQDKVWKSCVESLINLVRQFIKL